MVCARKVACVVSCAVLLIALHGCERSQRRAELPHADPARSDSDAEPLEPVTSADNDSHEEAIVPAEDIEPMDGSAPSADVLREIDQYRAHATAPGRGQSQGNGQGPGGTTRGGDETGSQQPQRLQQEVHELVTETEYLKKVTASVTHLRESERTIQREHSRIRNAREHPLDEAARQQDDAVKQLERAGEGLQASGDKFDRIYENPFQSVEDNPLSTFSIDVDTASYSKMRQYLTGGRLPPPDSVRIEELINYFPYDYLGPMAKHPFAADLEVAECPWQPEHRIARIAIKGRDMIIDKRPPSNLVFLLDVSGSMNQANKLPLVIKGMRMLVEQLGENDRVAIVVYAGAAGTVLPSTAGDQKAVIVAALDKLHAGGSTAGAAGIELAYKTAQANFIEGGVNRVLLCTDGDFNVGISGTGELVRLAEENAKQKIFLSILGYGAGNLNDAMLEQVSGKANGMYAFIDTENEARKVLVEQMSGTLVTIAKDVKIQIEFNPAKVQGYRLIGYENRILAAEDFNDDQKDAGEIGAGHTVTAIYQIVPVGAPPIFRERGVDDLKYQDKPQPKDAVAGDELLTLKLRYKQPEGDISTLISFPVKDSTKRFGEASDDFQFASSVASFGMLLRGSRFAGNANYDSVLEIAKSSVGDDPWGYRKEFVTLVEQAKTLAK